MNIFGLDNSMQETDKHIVNQIVFNAKKFVRDNRDAIKKLLNDYLQKNELLEKSDFFKKEKIFFLSGQTIAGLLTDIKGVFKYNEYNDLDIFITSYGYDSADEFDEIENTDAKYWSSDNENNVIDFVVNDGYDPVSLKNINEIKPQFIKINNTYSLYQMKDVPDRMQKAAFMVLDNFDLNNVKIGLAVSSELDSVDLIIHPDLIDNMKKYNGLPTISKPKLVTLMRSLNKFYYNIDTQYIISERDRFYKKYDEYLKAALSDYRYANHLCRGYFTVKHYANIKYQINTLKKYFDTAHSASNQVKRIEDSIKIIQELKWLPKSENDKDSIEYLSSKLVTEFDDHLIYSTGQLRLDTEEREIKTILESVLEKIMKNNIAITATQSTSLLQYARKIENKSTFDEFITEIKIADLPKEMTNWATIFKMLKLFIKNFDRLIKKHSVRGLVEIYNIMIENDFFIELIEKHYYQDKMFMKIVEEITKKQLLKSLTNFFNKYDITLDNLQHFKMYLQIIDHKLMHKIVANESLNIDNELNMFIQHVFREEDTYFYYDSSVVKFRINYTHLIIKLFSDILGNEFDRVDYACIIRGEQPTIYIEAADADKYDITHETLMMLNKYIYNVKNKQLVKIDSSEIIIKEYPQIAKILKKRQLERMINEQI